MDYGEIKLEFNSTKNFQTALLMVSNALDRVRGMPEEIMKPTIETSGSEDAPIAWIMLRPIKKINKESTIYSFNENFMDLNQKKFPSLKAQIPSISDDIAYMNHDLDYGFRAGFFKTKNLKILMLYN